MNELVDRLTMGENLFLMVGGGIAALAILCGAVKNIVSSVARERTRREIAAYIAEGAMTPEQGEKLMAAGIPKTPGCC